MKSNCERAMMRSRSNGLGLNCGEIASAWRCGVVSKLVLDTVTPPAPVVGPVAHPGVARTLRFMAQNFQCPIQVKGLTEVAGLSRRGFFKAFLRHTGLRPAQALRQLRIKRAQQLLLGSELSLSEVAGQCGYRSVNSFWVSFRQVTGVAPGQYRQQAGSGHQYRLPAEQSMKLVS